MREISSTDAVRSFGDCLSKVRHTGESYLILRNNQPVAALTPPPGNARLTVGEFIKAWQDLEFDSDFVDDLDNVNASDQPMDNPWD